MLQVVTDRDRRGAQIHAIDLQPELRMLGCNVETVALAPGRHGEGLPIEILGVSRRSFGTLRALRRRTRDYDVVIAHGSTTLFACAAALLMTGRPFVYRQISDPLYWASTWRRRLRVGVLLRCAIHVVCLSPSIAETFARHYRLRPDRITVIPNAVPGKHFSTDSDNVRASVRADRGIRVDEHVVLYAGALVHEKGVDLAIRCLADRRNATLLIAGDGPARSDLEVLAAEVLGDRCQFLGSEPDLRPLYRAADVFIMPTRGGDSMPAVLIEAGICRLPAITCPVGAIIDVVVDGETGLIVPVENLVALRNSVARVLDDNELRLALGERAESHCRDRFTVEATAPSWLDVLNRASERSPQQAVAG